jgi:hypothetical protein
MRRSRSTKSIVESLVLGAKQLVFRQHDGQFCVMACKKRTAFVAAVLFLLFSVACCNAGDAVFSSDGERVFLISDIESKPAVEEIDLKKKTTRKILLTQLDRSDSLRGITCTHRNRFFCTTAKAIWSFEPESGRETKIRDAPTGVSFWRIAYDPKMQRVFVTTDDREHPIFTFNDPAEWIPVRMRRHPYPSSLAFAANGELFFAAYGDLWCGEIRTDKIDEQDDFSITAYRCTPLATLETQNTTPVEIGVADIGVNRDTVYLQLSRMGGSGDGWFARLPRPSVKRDTEGEMEMFYQPKERVPIYLKALHSLEILGEDSRAGSICVSLDGTRVHYVLHDKHWLVTNGKTEELHLREQ